MGDVTFHLLKITISICIALITIYVVPFIKGKIQDAKYARLVDAIYVAVDAVEQTIKEPGMGKVKKEEVVHAAYEWMNKHGFYMTDEQLNNLIEHFVFEINRNK